MSKARHFEKDVESGFKTFLVTFRAVGKGHASDYQFSVFSTQFAAFRSFSVCSVVVCSVQ